MNTRNKLYRSAENRVFGGVLAGLAQHTGLDVGLLRIATVVLTLLGVGFPAYIIAWIIIPKAPVELAEELSEERPGLLTIAIKGLFVFIALAILIDGFDTDISTAAFIVSICVGLYFMWKNSGNASDSDEERFGLHRSVDDAKIAGVFGGLAEMMNVDPTMLRIVGAVLLFVTFPVMLVLYFLYALIIPKQRATQPGVIL